MNLERQQVEAPKETESKKPSDEILHQEVEEGVVALNRPIGRLLLSGVSAGLDVGFSLFLMAVLWTLFNGTISHAALKLLVANAYSVGFIFVVLGRSELFTEQTTLAILPVLDGQASVRAVGRLWALVYVANVFGGAVFALLATMIGPAMGVVDPQAFGVFATTLTAHSGPVILASAILAGWLMGLMSWLVTAARDTISQIAIIWLIATVIGVCGLHHAVVGTIEVLAGVFAGQGVSMTDYFHFLLWTTLGNAIGGPFFVAFIKFGHITQFNPHPPADRWPDGKKRSEFDG